MPLVAPSVEPEARSERKAFRVSVIVPTWNEAEYLPTLLASLRRQTRPVDEILIADSDSTDGTAEVARAAGAQVLEGARKGPGEGRNRGARAAIGDVFLFLDADCQAPPGLVAAVLKALDDPEVVGGTTGFSPDGAGIGERILFALANGYQRAATLWGFPHNAGYCFFFRRRVFEALRGLREDMFLNETHDLALRSRSLGEFVILPLHVRTSLRRFRAQGTLRTVLREYVASTLVYYATGRTPAERFRPTPAR